LTSEKTDADLFKVFDHVQSTFKKVHADSATPGKVTDKTIDKNVDDLNKEINAQAEAIQNDTTSSSEMKATAKADLEQTKKMMERMADNARMAIMGLSNITRLTTENITELMALSSALVASPTAGINNSANMSTLLKSKGISGGDKNASAMDKRFKNMAFSGASTADMMSAKLKNDQEMADQAALNVKAKSTSSGSTPEDLKAAQDQLMQLLC